MKSNWEKIEKWFIKNNKEVLKTFNKPAQKKSVENLEKLVGKPLPESFKEFYSVHDGQDTGMIFNSAVIEPDSQGMSPISTIITEWEIMNSIARDYPTEVTKKDVEKGIKPMFWNPLWIPVISDGMGNYFCIDLDPDKGGKPGQIIFRDHEGPTCRLVAKSFKEWVEIFVEGYLD